MRRTPLTPARMARLNSSVASPIRAGDTHACDYDTLSQLASFMLRKEPIYILADSFVQVKVVSRIGLGDNS